MRPSLPTLLLTLAPALLEVSAPVTAQEPAAPGPAVTVAVQPPRAFLEQKDLEQDLNIDFLLDNPGPVPQELTAVALEAYDRSGALLLRRTLDGNGFSPGITTLPSREVPAKGRLLVFNPFPAFRQGLRLDRLVFTFTLEGKGTDSEREVQVVVHPEVYRSRVLLSLPLEGRIAVQDGHDFYAHHRRLDTEHPAARHFGLTHNFMRYSLDLTPTDGAFRPFKGDGSANSDWFGWGRSVSAPADGTVVDAGDGAPDNERGQPSHFDPEALLTTPMRFYGNYIVIDHGHGEFSLLGHLQKGSLTVKTGDRVRRGQPVARLGSSGSSNNPHLHFELRTGDGLAVEGLPATFGPFLRHLGSDRLRVSAGTLDTGDLVEAIRP